MTLSVTFKPSPRDAADALSTLTPGNWGRYERTRYVLAGISLMLLAFFLIARYDWQFWGLFILNWEHIASFAFAGAIMGWLYGRVRPGLATDDPRLAERKFTIERDGLRIEGKGYETAIDWTGVREIAERGNVLLFATEWKDVPFVLARAFPTPAAARAFAQAARYAWSARRDEMNAGSRGAR